jgi:DNA-binding NtrC family response regulator
MPGRMGRFARSPTDFAITGRRSPMNQTAKRDRVLFVDDEPNVLNSIRRNLIDADFIVMTCDDPTQVLDILENYHIAVLVTDLKMPEMSGIELIRRVENQFPDVTKIVLTAHYQPSTILCTMRAGNIFHYFTKPWKFDEEFIPVLGEAITRHKERLQEIDAWNKMESEIRNLKTRLDTLQRECDATREKNRKQEKIIRHLMKNARQGRDATTTDSEVLG